MNKNYHSEYIKNVEQIVEKNKSEYSLATQRARNKNLAGAKFYNRILQEYNEIEKDLGFFSRILIDLNEIYDTDSSQSYDALFNSAIKKAKVKNKSVLVLRLAKFEALSQMILFLQKYIPTDSRKAKSKLFWKGDNKTEFIQFVYALFYAGKLSNDSNEITNLVQDLAQALNFSLGKNWRTNLSASKNRRNADYFPEIFDQIKQGYLQYQSTLRKDKKK